MMDILNDLNDVWLILIYNQAIVFYKYYVNLIKVD